jgi:Carboxypeptidase regulatory-like domain
MVSAFRSTWTSFLLAFMVLALSVGAFAQGAGQLTGQVTDSTGALVSGVEVKLTNAATGEVRTTITTSAGTYNFPSLPIVGTYSLEIATKGFKSVKVQNIVVTVGQITTRDAKLEVGAATEQVTVEAGAQLVQTEDASLSQDVDRRVWQDMPLESRDQNAFIALTAGAEPAANAMLGTDRGAAVNGARSGSGNFMVDGFSNNDQGLGGGGSLGTATGGANTTISPDAIEEYRVIAGTPAAEYGQAGGFVTDTVLKGGTNQWHGSLFEYNRIQALAANSWFSDFSGSQDHLIRNQFGGSVGGPIIKDRTFFYFTAEAHRLRIGAPLTGDTYTPDFVNFVQSGAFETFIESSPDGMCNNPAFIGALNAGLGTSQPVAPCVGAFAANATTGPVYNKMAASQTIPTCASTAANCTPSSLTAKAQGLWTGGTANAFIHGLALPALTYPVNIYGQITVSQPLILNQMRYSTKVDHKIGPKDQISASYLYDNADTTEPFAGNVVDFGPTSFNHGRAQNAGVTWSHTFSPTILNQARMAYVRHTANFPGDPTVTGMPSTLVAFDEPSIGFGNNAGIPQFFTENEFVYKDDLSVTKGKNNFKGGAEYRRTRNGSSFDSYKNGYNIDADTEDLLTDATFTNNFENYFLGGPVFGSIIETFASLNPQTGQLPLYYRGYRANEVALYIQDDWRVKPRLTLNMGLRWEYFGPPHNYQPGLDANFYTGAPIEQPNPCPASPACTGAPNPFYAPATSTYYGAFATGSVQQRDSNIWNKDLHNFGPRLGFAYDVLGNAKVVLRGGFGINYDRLYNNVFENMRFNPPFFAVGELGSFGNGTPVTNAIAAPLVTYPFTGTSSFLNYPLTPSIRAVDQNLEAAYYEQAHLGVQYQLGKDFVWETNYVGTFGHRLIDIEGRNNYDGRFLSGNGFDETPVNADLGNISFRTNCCDSNYHGLQTTLRKRFSTGLEFNANYTYAKAMDSVSDAFTTKNAGSAAYPTDSMNPKLDYGPADFDVKSRIVASFVYDLPFARGNRWLGGWNISGIVTWQTGPDFSINNSSVDSNADGQFNDRANYIGPGKLTNDINHHQEPWRGYLTTDNPDGSNNAWGMLNGPHSTDIPCPASVNMGLWCQGRALGQMERNTLTGPAYFNTDFGVKKTFKITERATLRFDANFFNLFNHPNFQPPDSNLNDGTFGQSTATFSNLQSGGPRVTQLAVRFDF